MEIDALEKKLKDFEKVKWDLEQKTINQEAEITRLKQTLESEKDQSTKVQKSLSQAKNDHESLDK